MKVRLTRGIALLTILTAGFAIGLLYRSWDSQTSTWESGVLVQFGSTLLLFVPLAYLTYRIETGLDRVSTRQEEIATQQEETASDVHQLAEEVAQTQADLRLTREQLSEMVRERITENKSKDSALFKAVGEAPSQADVFNSLVRAMEMGVIPDQERRRCAAPLARPPPGSALRRPPGTGAPRRRVCRRSAGLIHRTGVPGQRIADSVKGLSRSGISAPNKRRAIGLGVVGSQTGLRLDRQDHLTQQRDQRLRLGSAVPVRNGQAEFAVKKRDLDTRDVIAQFPVRATLEGFRTGQQSRQSSTDRIPAG